MSPGAARATVPLASGRPRTPGHFGLFVRYCAGFVAAYMVVISLGGALSMSIPTLDEYDHARYVQAQVSGTHHLLALRFAQTPPARWPALREEVQRGFAYPIELVTLQSTRRVLKASQFQHLQDGAVVLRADARKSYQRLSGSDQVLVLGDFNDYPMPPAPWYASDLVHVLVLLFNAVIAVALPLYFLLYRVWRDVYVLGAAALAIHDGRLHADIPPTRTRLVHPLQQSLQAMASRLRALMDAQRILSDAVAHEVRTPLARMRFGMEMLREATSQRERERELDGVLGDIARLERLTEAGVGYSRIGCMQRVERAPVMLDALFDQVLSAQTPPHPIQCSIRIQPEIHLWANREALQLALRNLVGNALRFARSRVRLTASCEGGWVILSVDDDGDGVDIGQRDKIFAPYVQLHAHADGFGLGLAIVRVVAEKHGGEADVRRSALGGAQFRLLLPP